MPETRVYLSTIGRPVEPSEAVVSVFDRGFLYGDSVYETMRTVGGRPLEFERHVERLHGSATAIGLKIPYSAVEIATAVEQTHAATGNDESYVRVVVTRGTGPIALDPRTSELPTLVVMVQPLRLPSPEAVHRGISAVLVHAHRSGGGMVGPGIKTGNYLANILALRHAIARGADDALLCNDRGEVAEGATSNVFVVQGGRVRTPHLDTGLLPGITRRLVCELAKAHGIDVDEGVVTPAGLRDAEEIFLTSSVRGIMPVTRLDGVTVGAGIEGPTTAALRARYEAHLQALAGRRRSGG